MQILNAVENWLKLTEQAAKMYAALKIVSQYDSDPHSEYRLPEKVLQQVREAIRKAEQ